LHGNFSDCLVDGRFLLALEFFSQTNDVRHGFLLNELLLQDAQLNKASQEFRGLLLKLTW